jgi:hypothetical protein
MNKLTIKLRVFFWDVVSDGAWKITDLAERFENWSAERWLAATQDAEAAE